MLISDFINPSSSLAWGGGGGRNYINLRKMYLRELLGPQMRLEKRCKAILRARGIKKEGWHAQVAMDDFL